jgi:hypothetical protein
MKSVLLRVIKADNGEPHRSIIFNLLRVGTGLTMFTMFSETRSCHYWRQHADLIRKKPEGNQQANRNEHLDDVAVRIVSLLDD